MTLGPEATTGRTGPSPVIVAVLLGVALLVAAVVLVVLMVQQPTLTPVSVPTVAIT